MRRLKSRADEQPAFSDLLPYANLIDSGVVTTKRGFFLAGWYFRPPDTASATDEMQASINARVNEAMLSLGTGWSSWTDVVSTESSAYPHPSESHFPDPISRAVDNERRESFEREGNHYENERVFILCYAPPRQQVSKLEDMMYAGTGETVSASHRVLGNFKKAIQKFEDHCGDLIGMRRMESYGVVDGAGRMHHQDELVNYLHYAVNGEPSALILPAAGAYMDSVIGSKDFWTGEVPVLGDEYLCCISIDGFPAESFPNIVANLNAVEMPYRFSQRAIYLDGPDGIKEIAKYKRQWGQKAHGLLAAVTGKNNGTKNEHALEMEGEAKAAMSLADSGRVSYLFYSATVVLRHKSEEALADMAQRFCREIRNAGAGGFGYRIETTNTVDAFLGTLPGDVVANVRRPLMHTANLCDLLPLAGIWTGLEHNPCKLYPPNSPPLLYAATEGAIPFRLNVHVNDVGHTFIFGPTGAGKSTLLATVAIQALRYEGMQVWSFDYKRGMYATVMACRGKHFEIGDSGSPSFCPLSVLESEDDIGWAGDWIEACYLLQTGKSLIPGQRMEVGRALRRFSDEPKDKRSLSQFLLFLQDQEVSEAMEFYTLEGPAGWLLDAPSDSITISNFNVFETIDIMGKDDIHRVPVLLYLFRRFERSLNGRPTILLLDEAWVVLGNKIWSEKLHDWLKLLRSKNCAVIIATQSLSDAFKSGLLNVLVESCPTKIWLGNPEAPNTGTPENPGPNDLYRSMNLNENQIEIIRTARQKYEYYVTSPEGCRLINLGIGPLGLAFSGATSEKEVGEIRDMVRDHGEDWMWRYLEEKGVDYARYLEADDAGWGSLGCGIHRDTQGSAGAGGRLHQLLDRLAANNGLRTAGLRDRHPGQAVQHGIAKLSQSTDAVFQYAAEHDCSPYACVE
jgi:type IV secretion system protein VirB4